MVSCGGTHSGRAAAGEEGATGRAIPAAGIGLRRRRMRLLEIVDLADMLRRTGELETDDLAMPAGPKLATLDHRDLMRHVGVRRIMRDRVDADCGTISPGLHSCAMAGL